MSVSAFSFGEGFKGVQNDDCRALSRYPRLLNMVYHCPAQSSCKTCGNMLRTSTSTVLGLSLQLSPTSWRRFPLGLGDCWICSLWRKQVFMISLEHWVRLLGPLLRFTRNISTSESDFRFELHWVLESDPERRRLEWESRCL